MKMKHLGGGASDGCVQPRPPRQAEASHRAGTWLGPDRGPTIRFLIGKHRCTPGALPENQAPRVLKGNQTCRLSRHPTSPAAARTLPSQVSLAVVPGRASAWLVTSRHTQATARVCTVTVPPAVTSPSTTGTRAGGDRPVFIHKLCCYQLSTDHTIEAAEGKPVTEALSLPCGLHHPRGASIHSPFPSPPRPGPNLKGPASFCPGDTAWEAGPSCLVPRHSPHGPFRKAPPICQPPFYQGPGAAASTTQRARHIADAQ